MKKQLLLGLVLALGLGTQLQAAVGRGPNGETIYSGSDAWGRNNQKQQRTKTSRTGRFTAPKKSNSTTGTVKSHRANFVEACGCHTALGKTTCCKVRK